jgi:hypothetical protein
MFGYTNTSGEPEISGYILCGILAPLRTPCVDRSIRDHFFLIRDIIRLRVSELTLSAMRKSLPEPDRHPLVYPQQSDRQSKKPRRFTRGRRTVHRLPDT